MRPVLPVLALAALVALPATAGAHHHAAKAHAAKGASAAAGAAGARADTPSALATPYDYGTDPTSAKAGAATTTDSDKAMKASQDDLATLSGMPNSGAAKKHGKAQVLQAY